MLETRICARTSGRKVLQSLLFASASAVAICGFAGAAGAQNAPDSPTQTPPSDKANTVKEVVVTGIRASLQSAQSIKRNADVFVDSVSAEDIGALPDRSVAEALQRIPGVTIDRFSAGNDPDHYSVEGSGVTIRGLPYTRSEFNGRDAFTANNGQGLSFQDVPAELMGGIDVFKNNSADMIEGGIAGDVNLRTRLPFDQAGRVISLDLEDTYADMEQRLSPSGSLFYTDRWNTPLGEFGLLLDYADTDLKTEFQALQIANWGQRTYDPSTGALGEYNSATGLAPGQQKLWMPRGADMREDQFDHHRIGDTAAFQWRSPDHTLLATVQFMRSDARETWNEHAVEVATDVVTGQGDSQFISGTTPKIHMINPTTGVFESGAITGNTGWRSDQNGAGTPPYNTPVDGLETNDEARGVNSRDVNEDESLNLQWRPNDHWKFNLDVQHSQSHVTDLDLAFWQASYSDLGINMAGKNGLPSVVFLPASANGNPAANCTAGVYTSNCTSYLQSPNSSYTDGQNNFTRSLMDHYENSDGVENAVKLDAEYKIDNDFWLTAVKGGLRWAETDQTTRFSNYNWGVVSEQWGNNGPIWDNNPAVPTGIFQPFTFPGFMRGEATNPYSATGPRLFYAGPTTSNYAGYAANAWPIENAWCTQGTPSNPLTSKPSTGAGWAACGNPWVPLANRLLDLPGSIFEPGEINPQTETNKAAYVMFRYAHSLDNGVKFSGNFGLRYVHIDRSSEGYIQAPLQVGAPTDCSTIPAGQTPPPFCQLSPAERQAVLNFENGALFKNNQKMDMDYWLPSFNMKVELKPGHIIRVGVEKAVTPPQFGFMRDYLNPSPNLTNTTLFLGTPGNYQPQIITTEGNPMLRDTESLNFDLGYEWYFAKLGMVSVAVFEKQLKDVVVAGTTEGTVTNNGATFPSLITQPVNAPGIGKASGFELDYQQTYSFLPGFLSGLGLNANYTFVASRGVGQSTLNSTSPDVSAGIVSNIDLSKLPLQGMSKNSFNITPFYEKGPVSLRLAYSWRSRFLLTTRDVIVPYAPIFQEATGTLDGSLFYSINKHLKLGVQGVNLTNEVTKTSSVLQTGPLLTEPRSYFMSDRRITAILRATF